MGQGLQDAVSVKLPGSEGKRLKPTFANSNANPNG